MSIVVYLIVLFFVGLIVGGLARLAIPGRDPMSIPATVAIGLLGSFIAGLISWAIFGRNGGGIVLSVLVSTGIVYAIRRSRGGTLTRPAPNDRLGPGR
jgi:uncharacterized membrane protein YeaQ/YmgE (transglycosylase-associated protein family)